MTVYLTKTRKLIVEAHMHNWKVLILQKGLRYERCAEHSLSGLTLRVSTRVQPVIDHCKYSPGKMIKLELDSVSVYYIAIALQRNTPDFSCSVTNISKHTLLRTPALLTNHNQDYKDEVETLVFLLF